MKTYSEQRGEEPFNWFKFLGKDMGNIEDYEMNEADDKATNWVTCACGNQCSDIPRQRDGKPEDKRLGNLGVDFSDHVSEMLEAHFEEDEGWFNESRNKACVTLNSIETRAAELISEINAKK